MENNYDIVLAHGPVVAAEYLGNDTFSFILDNEKEFTIHFSITNENGKKFYNRLIISDGKTDSSGYEFDVFDENLTLNDFVQWTADNFDAEILDYWKQ